MRHKLIIILFLLPLVHHTSGQMTPEKVYDHSLNSTKISGSEYKFYLMDVGNSQCRIYNLDHSLWKTINIALPSDYYLYDIKFVTRDLFNSDDQVELWYTAYNWVASGTDGYYRYISKVINENGSVIANIDNGLYAYIIRTGEENFRFAVYAYDNSFWPGSVKTYIFPIAGTSSATWHAVAKLSDPYPNPSDGLVHLPLFSEKNDAKVQVFTPTGHLILNEETRGQSVLRVDTRGWTPGIYTYRVVTSEGFSGSNKFTVFR